MGISIGIVGLPNVGKSTFFNTLTKSTIEVANYPFATIEPNVGIVNIKDPRLAFLKNVYKSKKIIPNYIKFIDIAGLVKGASEGKGLGNKFLSNIREVDAICEVVRCFENKDIVHIENRINPIDDIEIIHLELIIADLQTVNSGISKVARKAKNTNNKELIFIYETLSKAKDILESDKTLDTYNWEAHERICLKEFNLLTIKNKFFVVNVSENDWNNLDNNKMFQDLKNYLQTNKWEFVTIPLRFELDISVLSDEEQKLYQDEYEIKTSAIDDIINEGYKILNLKTFFTCGPEEIKAWTFNEKLSAKQCAGIIHTDIEDGFIKAEVIHYSDIKNNPDIKSLKDTGKVRIEGKEHHLEDGDVCYFHFKK